MLVLFFHVLLCFLATTVFSSNNESSVTSEIALLRFREGVVDPLAKLAGWNLSSNTCKWYGVTCSLQGHISGLSLQNIRLSSTALALLVQNLSYLESLHVEKSNFTEPMDRITPESCSLSAMELSRNHLNGSIPLELFTRCKQMRRLILSDNQLSGTIPSISSSCKHLETFDVSGNQISGSISPDTFLNCVALQQISLAYNRLSGAFPNLDSSNVIQSLIVAGNSFSRFKIYSVACSNLTQLDLSSNYISGRIFYADDHHVFCPKLMLLNISSNMLSGTLNELLGSKILDADFLPSLEVLDASHNKFEGQIIKVHSHLMFLNMSSNLLNATEDSLCRENSELKSLLLPNNKLVGRILESVTNCTRLEMLDLSFNSVIGEIPSTFCSKLSGLQHFLAYRNKLNGSIPSSLGDCSSLVTLILSYNDFQGSIPPELSKLQNLWWLSLSSNQLTGSLPGSFATLENMNIFQVSNNSLDGGVLEISSCPSLTVLDINGNNLSGEIPAHVGRRLTTAGGFGLAPVTTTTLGNSVILENKETMLRSSCKQDSIYILQGMRLEDFEESLNSVDPECSLQFLPIPHSSNTSFYYSSALILDFGHNRFSGHMPRDIGNSMNSLISLRLAYNTISGPIPESLGLLRALAVVDLSHNSLSGSLPGSLSQLTSLFKLDVSYNNLSGMIPQGGQLTTFDSSAYEGNPGLFGYPLHAGGSVGAEQRPATEKVHHGGYFVEEIYSAVIFFGFSFTCVSTITFFSCSKLIYAKLHL